MLHISNIFKISVLTTALVLCGPTFASEKSKIINKGAQKLSASQIAAMFIGKSHKGKWYYKDQKGSWKAEWRKDGSKHVVSDGKPFKTGRWTYDGKSKWCETITSKVKFSCEDTGIYKLRKTCYVFRPDGTKRTEWRC